MKVVAYFDGSFTSDNEGYAGHYIIYPNKEVKKACLKFDKKFRNSSDVEVLALYHLTKKLEEEKVEEVLILGDFEQLISRVNKLKTRILQKSFTFPNGFKNSSQYKIINKMIKNKNWELKKVKNEDNLAHDVSRMYLNK